jgi:hypothetical protein
VWAIVLCAVSCARLPPSTKADAAVPADPVGGDEVDTGPRRLQQSDVMEAVLSRKRELAQCTAQKTPGSTGKLVMEWSVGPDGQVSAVGPAAGYEQFAGTPMAACLTSVIQSMPFPKFDVPGEPVRFPFKF